MRPETWRNGANICIDNVNRLIEDGKLLIEKESYGHACFSFITALEEIGVAYFILSSFNEPKPKDLKRLLNHKKKMGITNIVNIIYTGEPEGITKKLHEILNSDDFETKSKKEKMSDILTLSDEIQKKENLWFLRNAGIYVKLDSSKKEFVHPGQISQTHAIKLYKRAKDASFFLQVERDKIEKFGLEFAKEFGSANSLIKTKALFEEVGSSFFSGSIEEIQSRGDITPNLKDLLTKLLLESYPVAYPELNLEITSLDDFNKIILVFLYEMLKEPISKIKEAEINPKIKEILDFTVKRWKFYSPKKGELLEFILKVFKDLKSQNSQAVLEYMTELEKLILEVEFDL